MSGERKMQKNKKVMTFRIDQDLEKKFKDHCSRKAIKPSSMIQLLIRKEVSNG